MNNCENCGAENIPEITTCGTCASPLTPDVTIRPDNHPGRAARIIKLLLLAAVLAGLARAVQRLLDSGQYEESKATLQAELLRVQERNLAQDLKTAAGTKTDEQAEKEAAEAERRAKFWAVSGKVYDLISLKPIAGARITFMDVATRRVFSAESQATGNYSVDLPKTAASGYAVTVKHRKYGTVYTEEGYTPYYSQSLERRREARDMLRSMKIMHVPILPPREEANFDHNIVMARLGAP